MIRGAARGSMRGGALGSIDGLVTRGGVRSRRRTREVGDPIDQPGASDSAVVKNDSVGKNTVMGAGNGVVPQSNNVQNDAESALTLLRWNSTGGTSKAVQIKQTYLPQSGDSSQQTEQRIIQLIRENGNNVKQSQLPLLWKKKFGSNIPLPKGKTLLELLGSFANIRKQKDPKTHDTVLLPPQTAEGLRQEILSGLARKDIETWTTADVCAWMEDALATFKLSPETVMKYTGAVRDNSLRGEHLAMLQSHDLETCLGIGPLGHRLTLLKARDLLCQKSMDQVCDGVRDAAQHSATAAVATVDAVRLVETLASSVSELHSVVRALGRRVEAIATKTGCAPEIPATVGGGGGGGGGGGAVAASKSQKARESSVPGQGQQAQAQAQAKRGGKEEGAGAIARPATHFISLPISDPEVVSKLAEVQAAVEKESPWYTPGIISRQRLHVSLAILHCPDQAVLDRAIKELGRCQSKLAQIMSKQQRFEVEGLGTFKQGVLWAGIKGGGALKEAAAVLAEAMERAGALPGKREELKAHVTLMKTSYFTQTERKAAARHSLTAPTQWMQTFGAAPFGAQQVGGLALCAMKGADGGYVTEHWLPLGGSSDGGPPLSAWAALPSVVTWSGPQAALQLKGQAGAGGGGVKVGVKLQFVESGKVEVLVDVHDS